MELSNVSNHELLAIYEKTLLGKNMPNLFDDVKQLERDYKQVKKEIIKRLENKINGQKVIELFYLLFQSAQLEVDNSHKPLDTDVNMKTNELKHYLDSLVGENLEEKYKFYTPELLEEAMLSVTKELTSTVK